jgi:excisionase family DNA binding protein
MLETQTAYMTVNEVAQHLRVHPLTVYRKIKSGELEAVRLTGGSRLRVRPEAVERLLTASQERKHS